VGQGERRFVHHFFVGRRFRQLHQERNGFTMEAERDERAGELVVGLRAVCGVALVLQRFAQRLLRFVPTRHADVINPRLVGNERQLVLRALHRCFEHRALRGRQLELAHVRVAVDDFASLVLDHQAIELRRLA